MRTLVALSLLVVLASGAAAEERAIGDLFARQGLEGTMVLSSLRGGRTFVHNADRAGRRLPIASTFKILNTLIALEEGAIGGKDEVVRWDGTTYDFPDWNRDQTLESAFKASCVWFYQALARRVGAGKYRSYLHKLRYGKLREPFDETTFWLDGSLQISAREQVQFLKRVYRRSLPFKASSYETLRQVMLAEKTPEYSLWAKTGWAQRAEPQVGWYVGYVETADDVWFFATNLDVRSAADLPLRRALTLEALKAKGILP